ncbi:hypothetical protein [Nocardioides sp.]|uniref:hypothetical protein n=1 Tax=Nocardioides sp. TaxID=35761 RepID=UPI003569CA06
MPSQMNLARAGSDPVVTAAPLPPGADGTTELEDVACTTKGTCVAVGSFSRANQSEGALIVLGKGGNWTALEPPAPRGVGTVVSSSLWAVSCAGARRCVAIGGYFGQGRARPLLEIWNGKTWKTKTPRLPSNAAKNYSPTLEAISCGGRNACVAAGTYTTRAHRARPFFVTWRSGRVRTVAGALPGRKGSGEIWAVDCAAPASCVAVGSMEPERTDGSSALPQRPLAYRLKGDKWRAMTPPLPGAGKQTHTGFLYDVSCPRRDRCTAVGPYHRSTKPRDQGLVAVFRPRGWTSRKVAAPHGHRRDFATLGAVACRATNVCIAAGNYSTPEGPHVLAMLARLKGGAGRGVAMEPGDSRPSVLEGVACVKGSACVAVGMAELQRRQTPLLAIMRGSRVTASFLALPEPATFGHLHATALSSSTTAVAIGWFGGGGQSQTGMLVSGIRLD